MFDHSDSCGTDLMGDFEAPDGKDTRGEKTEQINTWKRSSWETMGSIFFWGARKKLSPLWKNIHHLTKEIIMFKAFVEGMIDILKVISKAEEERLSSYDPNWERDYIEYMTSLT